MQFKLGAIQIFVSNLEKAKEWYQKILGAKIIKEYREFKCVLMKLNEIELDIGVPNSTWGEDWKTFEVGSCILTLEVEDIQKAYEALKNKGAKFIEKPHKTPWNEIKAALVDPDGNRIILIQEV